MDLMQLRLPYQHSTPPLLLHMSLPLLELIDWRQRQSWVGFVWCAAGPAQMQELKKPLQGAVRYSLQLLPSSDHSTAHSLVSSEQHISLDKLILAVLLVHFSLGKESIIWHITLERLLWALGTPLQVPAHCKCLVNWGDKEPVLPTLRARHK